MARYHSHLEMTFTKIKTKGLYFILILLSFRMKSNKDKKNFFQK
jgi:hypothetical protein